MCSSSIQPSSSGSSFAGGYDLIVEGIPLGSGGQFTPRLTMKRVYDTKCFRPERYRHEVANHYRDYKLQQHLHQHQHHFGQQRHRSQRRRRRRQFFGGPAPGGAAEASRVSASLASQYAQFRDVWPTHLHYFPRSDDTTTSSSTTTTATATSTTINRGRGEPPPDATYNDAVRRIRSAHSCEQLRQLVQRQLVRHRLPWRSSSTTTGNDEALAPKLGGSQSSRREDYKLNIHKRSAESPQQRQQPQGRHTGGKEGEEQVQQQRQRVDFYAYLQLASGYYERGLQADLKYLQSIGQPQQQQQQQQRRHHHHHHHHHRNAIKPATTGQQYLDDAVSQRSESPVQRLTGRLVTLLKSLRRKAAAGKRRAGHPEIRVNIRSVRREQQDQEQREREQQEKEGEEDHQTDEEEPEQEQEEEEEEEEEAELDSMCDYYAQAVAAAAAGTLEGPARASGIASVATTVVDQRRLYEIIDNLSHLSIAGEAAGEGGGGVDDSLGRRQHLQLTLPQITLTDCTNAQQVALYSASFDSIVTLQMRPAGSSSSSSSEARPAPSRANLRAT